MLNSINNLKIKWKLMLLIVIAVAGFSINSLFMNSLMNKIMVNGPVYKEIVTNKDLVADILPPPEYIIETFLTAMQMKDEKISQAVEKLIEKCDALKKDYASRHEFWQHELPAGQIKTELIETFVRACHGIFQYFGKRIYPRR